ncbi:chemotaxis protein methyltransferase CheR [Methylocapsa palsarum]|uniref:Chemotaxis protein methyltransferase CheR n=1 Tax=Methylocapsa palsarum TaxID=1612308 RepID=A0A1I3W028_9HYPH|nr:chemotaxis protein methyltransferase CheR [Methylocapsa palsarum]
MTTLFKTIEDPGTLAQAIVDTIREPLLVLGDDLCVLAVSRSYCLMFEVASSNVLGQSLYALGDGQWRIPDLGALLEKVLREHIPAECFEVEHEFPRIGRRTMLLNAREVFYDHSARTTLLLAFEDVTALRAADREKDEFLRRTEELIQQKDVLLREMEHRVGNSLQIIASILMLKARTVPQTRPVCIFRTCIDA